MTVGQTLQDNKPFSHENALSATCSARLHSELEAVGVRLYPYPFFAAASVVNDVDSSLRSRYDAYLEALVHNLGLDFGDSIWLQIYSPSDRPLLVNGFGFFSRQFGLGHGDPAALYENTRTFCENLVEYHTGNVDHFHSFLTRGPRIVVLDDIQASKGTIAAQVGPLERSGYWSCHGFVVSTVFLVWDGDEIDETAVVELEDSNGLAIAQLTQAQMVEGRNGPWLQVFNIPFDAIEIPRIDKISRVLAHLRSGRAAEKIRAIVLGNSSGYLILDRLRLLRSQYHVEASLITTHSSYHFRNEYTARNRDALQQKQIETGTSTRLALTGNVDYDGLLLSTDADEPASTHRVFPELTQELGLRFIIPGGFTASDAIGSAPLDLIRPAKTRMGTGIYVAKRVLPNLSTPLVGRKFDGTKSLRSNFAGRITEMLDQNEKIRGLCWPIYTHLGALEQEAADETTRGQRAMPTPYLETPPLHRLQDQVFGISRRTVQPSRIWFTRASTLYDYILMLRSIAPNVTRPGANLIEIRSWQDPILQVRLPVSINQLYGMTFYVHDAAAAVVRLDGNPIDDLIRNPPDHNGRPSVTIGACPIRYALFERLNPLADVAQTAVANGNWEWIDQDPALGSYGRLRLGTHVSGAEPIASLRIPLFGLTPVGAQLFRISMRLSAHVSAAILFETVSGGRFIFGDESLVSPAKGPITASYMGPARQMRQDGWTTLVVPFHDLKWAAGAEPGGSMPSQSLAAFTLLCQGPAGGVADFARAAFLRPRTTGEPPELSKHLCLGGRVEHFVSGQVVQATRSDAPDGITHQEPVDQRGYFCFSTLHPGIYRVWSNSEVHEFRDRRGALVELGADVLTLSLAPQESQAPGDNEIATSP